MPIPHPSSGERLAYSPGELAKYLGVSERHVRDRIRKGEIHSFTIGRSRRIPTTEVTRLLQGAGQVD